MGPGGDPEAHHLNTKGTTLPMRSLPDRAFDRSVPGFPAYCIDQDGTVYNKRTGDALRVRIVGGLPCVDVDTRPRATAQSRPSVPVRLLVARAWLPRLRAKDRGATLRHLDGDQMNSRADNLVWRR